MKWEDSAIYDLKHYRIWKISIDNIQERIQMNDERLKSCRTVQLSGMPSAHGSGERTVDDTWIDCIVERDNLSMGLSLEQKRVKMIEKGLAALSAEEQLVLSKFYIDRPKNYLDDLCEALHVERSKVYNIRKNALRKFTLTQYGIDT